MNRGIPSQAASAALYSKPRLHTHTAAEPAFMQLALSGHSTLAQWSAQGQCAVLRSRMGTGKCSGTTKISFRSVHRQNVIYEMYVGSAG
jgi:hypothetical protein